MKGLFAILLILGVMVCSGCANQDQSPENASAFSQNPNYALPAYKTRKYRPLNHRTQDDLWDSDADEGSLWASSGQTRYYFVKNKIKDPGESIGLLLEGDLYKEILEELTQSLHPDERSMAMSEFKQALLAKFKNNVAPVPAPAAPSALAALASGTTPAPIAPPPPAKTPPIPVSAIPRINSSINNTLALANTPQEQADLISDLPDSLLDISEQVDIAPNERLRAEVIARLPHDAIHIRAIKKISSPTFGTRLIAIDAKVKTVDISDDLNLIPGSTLYDTQIDISG